jgi:hypothetical protein
MTTTNRDNKGRFVKGHKQFNTGRTWLTSERMKGHKFNSGRELSEEHRKSISEAHKGKHKGKNNCGWKGGISFNPYGDGISSFLKNKIRRRDNQICMNCGIHREKLNRALDVHHINYDKKCHMEQNLIALCRSCHTKLDYKLGIRIPRGKKN